ncbi:MAG: radical SAM family heme chaperone HemW, partial [Desulfobacteraceae bacterium]|nr:radical SAM family heme chaperone HemW [Desulfobacteraceae bacterium]
MSENQSIYIHIPFCIQKCSYCDFYSNTDLELRTVYIKALTKELKIRSSKNTPIDTIYFGGGTPSVLNISDIETILFEVYGSFQIAKDTEITIEINPGTIDTNYLESLKTLGINRLSIGVQSFDDNKLSFLGRIHTAKQAIQSIENAQKSGFDNIGIDLIFAIPKENEADWHKDIQTALNFNLAHLSCYMLTIEPDTPLHNKVKNKLVSPMNKEAQA